MIGNYRFGRSDLLPAEFERLFRDRANGIDVVKINALQFIHAGIDVPWHGDIDDEERTIQALPQHRRLLAEQLRQMGYPTEVVSPEQLEYRNGQLSRGDFGTSIVYRAPALSVVLQRLPATAELAVWAMAH